jgi:hypothetical protein
VDPLGSIPVLGANLFGRVTDRDEAMGDDVLRQADGLPDPGHAFLSGIDAAPAGSKS